MRIALVAFLVAAGGLAHTATAVSPGADSHQPEEQPKRALPANLVKFRTRLEALVPTNPEAYFLLGEEVADEATDAAGKRLATELFVLAFDLDRRRAGRGATAAASCLALADVIKTNRDRRWLIALARTMDPRRTPPEWLSKQAAATTDSMGYQIATVLGLVRSGDGGPARQLLERPEVRAGLEAYDRILVNMGVSGGASSIIREAQRWPCPECQNERALKKPGANPPEYRVCPNCLGDPGPQLSESELVAQLRFESLLLQGVQRSWAAQVSADSGSPLMDPDPASLAGAFEVDPALVLWRNGIWVADLNAQVMQPPSSKPAQGSKPNQPQPTVTTPTPTPSSGS